MAAESSDNPAREFYELRLYHLRRGPKQKLFDDFYREAAIPAMNRIGLGPIGVFGVMTGPDSPTMYRSYPAQIDGVLRHRHRSGSRRSGISKGRGRLHQCSRDRSAYVRVESSLMVAFETVPKLEVPAATAEKKPRLFELRTYESHSKKANKKKIEMFNRGEIAIFRRAGLAPVFFGETLVGSKMPNLTYMLFTITWPRTTRTGARSVRIRNGRSSAPRPATPILKSSPISATCSCARPLIRKSRSRQPRRAPRMNANTTGNSLWSLAKRVKVWGGALHRLENPPCFAFHWRPFVCIRG